jgi:hypothetical protein
MSRGVHLIQAPFYIGFTVIYLFIQNKMRENKHNHKCNRFGARPHK